jgi:hypothetical protein
LDGFRALWPADRSERRSAGAAPIHAPLGETDHACDDLSRMPIHVAIMKRPYLQAILDGRKTMESRLTVRPLAPYRAIQPGERMFFKVSAGPFLATAVAGPVHFFEQLTPAKVVELKRRFNDRVLGDEQFWQGKRDSRFATFVELERVQPIGRGPVMEPSRGPAWFVLPDEAAPSPPAMFEVTLTQGAIRNHYLRIPRKVHEFAAKHYGGRTLAGAGEPVTLLIDGRPPVRTDIVSNGMVRWRGWGSVYEQEGASPGDAVRFVDVGDRRYRVTLIRRLRRNNVDA